METEIQFGRELDGSSGRPEWLRDDDQVMGYWLQWRGPYRVKHVRGFGEEYFKFKLPIDHFAYKAMDAGFEPWGGGDEAPDCEEVMFRNGTTADPSECLDWAHVGEFYDIIGYRKRAGDDVTDRFETVEELMEDLNTYDPSEQIPEGTYMVRVTAGDVYTVGKIYIAKYNNHVNDDDGTNRILFPDYYRPATPEEISAYNQANEVIPTGAMAPFEEVLVRRMTREEAGDLCQYTLACLGLLIDETPIQRFEREHGGLDDNQRDIVEAFIEWSAGK